VPFLKFLTFQGELFIEKKLTVQVRRATCLIKSEALPFRTRTVSNQQDQNSHFKVKSSEKVKDSVSKTNKRYFFTFIFASSAKFWRTVSLRLRLTSLLKTVFYKKLAIDVSTKWPYLY